MKIVKIAGETIFKAKMEQTVSDLLKPVANNPGDSFRVSKL